MVQWGTDVSLNIQGLIKALKKCIYLNIRGWYLVIHVAVESEYEGCFVIFSYAYATYCLCLCPRLSPKIPERSKNQEEALALATPWPQNNKLTSVSGTAELLLVVKGRVQAWMSARSGGKSWGLAYPQAGHNQSQQNGPAVNSSLSTRVTTSTLAVREWNTLL